MKLKNKVSLIEDWKKQLKSYSAISLFANILIALAYGLSLAFGMGLVYMSPFYIVLVMGGVASLGALGRFIKQQKEDEEDVQ
jgi:asparagine N-glycosylation enzyme membrane subunit Stt3